ncbi:MAG: Asp-tRNA(Asn)/Glu-tRNA(Gln) amidotransferase subunit GatC [Deltaproteobacteria bacterium]|nr:Asp-tRNA(Asn)/Glu-tRNA(Gln) amidotransferase subunit GatC [Deltaproteobacteria bacterium]MBI3391543.1 Asp-tRNA(Asn)/Glu-tRNA(Gln) amidotransferase subunit GatC [Deltaproteobacteria bacterium]
MPLSAEDVRHIALLARLDLSPDEERAFAAQLDHILTHFEKLKQLDTDHVEPTAHIVAIDTPFRDDVVVNTSAVDALLTNAPARDGRFFKVPKIIE